LLFVNNIYKRTLGFVLFKALFYSKKNLNKLKLFRQESKIEIFGRRGVLQIFLFIIFFVIMYPHTKLYTKEFGEISGRNSLLYKIIDTSDQDFYEEEILVNNINTNNSDKSNLNWKDGSISVENSKEVLNKSNKLEDLVSVTVGGSAVTKPTIIPGSELANQNSNGSQIVKTNRSEILEYVVQSGDVIGEIASRFGISVNTILWANNLTARSTIKPNQTLIILPTDGVTHKVVKNDTISKIAKVYGANSDEIIKFNKLEEGGADIVIGELLIVPGGKKVEEIKKPTYVATRPASYNNVVALPSSVEAPAGSGYLWPTAAKIVTQYYGLKHTGLDVAGPIGTAIYATKAGTVITSQCGYNGGYGCYIKIDHGNGVVSLYGHNSKLFVEVGDYVTQGQTIALMGSTGRSTGPHTHFEIRVNGKFVNPLSYVRK